MGSQSTHGKSILARKLLISNGIWLKVLALKQQFKIQPELISLDPLKLRQIDRKTLEEKMIERNKLLVGDIKPRMTIDKSCL
jgi:hypothetical protein